MNMMNMMNLMNMMNMGYQGAIVQFQNLKREFDFLEMKLQNAMMISNNELLINGLEIINIGIHTIKVSLENYNMNIQIPNINIQIHDLGSQLQNIGSKLENYGNLDQNNLIVPNDLDIQVKNIIFETREGEKNVLSFPFGITVEKVLESYLIKKPEIIKNSNLMFLYNGQKINPKDKTKIENYFTSGQNPSYTYKDAAIKR